MVFKRKPLINPSLFLSLNWPSCLIDPLAVPMSSGGSLLVYLVGVTESAGPFNLRPPTLEPWTDKNMTNVAE